MLGFLPGMSIDDIARREVDQNDLDQYGSGFDETKRGAFNWQDQLGAFLAGGDKEAVLKRAQELRDLELEREFEATGQSTRKALKGAGLISAYEGVSGKSRQQIKDALLEDEGRLKALGVLAGTKGYTPGLVSGNAGIIDINSATRSLLNSEEQRIETKADNRYDLELKRLDNIRADNMDANRADLEFRRDQMMLEDQRYNERLEREFQQNRRASLMAMMQGLASLGAAFAA